MSRSHDWTDRPSDGQPKNPGRRGFLKGAGITAAAAAVTGPAAAAVTAAALARQDEVKILGLEPVTIALDVNGAAREAVVEPWTTLLDCLRDRLDLTGAKAVCERGFCGACTVLVDGRAVNSCSFLAVDAVGRKITTVEGIAGADGQPAPIQQAFMDCDALQCGYCTPGMVVACHGLLARNPAPTRDQIKEGISGNICRCGTYQNIFEAVELVAKKGAGK